MKRGASSSRSSAARRRGRWRPARSRATARRIGMLTGLVEYWIERDRPAPPRYGRGSGRLGWIEGRNIHIEYRFASGRAILWFSGQQGPR